MAHASSYVWASFNNECRIGSNEASGGAEVLLVGSDNGTVGSNARPTGSDTSASRATNRLAGNKVLPGGSKLRAMGNNICSTDAAYCTMRSKFWRNHNKSFWRLAKFF